MDVSLAPHEAMPRAVVAYNHYIHITGLSPLKILFGLRGRQKDSVSTVVDNALFPSIKNIQIELGKIWGKVRGRIQL